MVRHGPTGSIPTYCPPVLVEVVGNGPILVLFLPVVLLFWWRWWGMVILVLILPIVLLFWWRWWWGMVILVLFFPAEI